MMHTWIYASLLSLATLTHASESTSDITIVNAHNHNSKMQRRWAISCLAPHLKQLKGNERILDIGCGDGKITADISRFIPQGNITGLESSKAMLDWALKQYSKLEYPNLSFQEGSFNFFPFVKKFDLIFSNCALQHCLNKSKAFRDLAGLLNSEGTLIIIVPAMDNLLWKKAFQNTQTNPNWNAYFKSVIPLVYLIEEDYIELLQNAGLAIQKVERIQTIDPFFDRQELIEFLRSNFNLLIPEDIKTIFCNELINEYIRLMPGSQLSSGAIEARFGRIEIEATKP